MCRGKIEALDEAQLQEYRDACNKEAEEREAKHSDSESDDEHDAETLDLQLRGGNRIPNSRNMHGLGNIVHNSSKEVIGKFIDYAHEEAESDKRRKFK